MPTPTPASTPSSTGPPVIARVALAAGAPLLLAVVGLAHPQSLTRDTAAHWTTLHIWLLPVFPLLALGVVVPLWGRRPGRDAAGLATLIAWAGAFGYAAFYTGLDAVAGIAAGTVRQHAGPGVPAGVVHPLYRTGDALGSGGAYALGVAVVAASLVLFPRHGVRVLPATAVLLLSCWSFTDSHIFWPRGVVTMAGFAAGFASLAALAAVAERNPRPERNLRHPGDQAESGS
ncbi:hypothetical protein [Streptomyces sp. NPDC047108]|uniref:hypothetical protein n=1 Tax=Streptomyces sp. NPDC047108 TaxID=3155025 RepID=UPI0033C7F486